MKRLVLEVVGVLAAFAIGFAAHQPVVVKPALGLPASQIVLRDCGTQHDRWLHDGIEKDLPGESIPAYQDFEDARR